MTNYIELRARSAFSFLQAASLPEELAETCADLQMPAMALVDRNGVYGAPRFHMAAKKAGVRAHIGSEITCTNGMLKFDSYSNQLATDQDGAYKPIEVQRLEPFAEELKNLIGAINGTEQLRVRPAWGRHIVEVLLAAEESSRSGREVVIPQRIAAARSFETRV